MQPRERPGWATLLAYAFPSLPLAGLGLPLVVHLPTYYAREIGLPLAAVGSAFLMVRLIDVVFDPLIGWGMDRTRTRLGRFRPWLIAATPTARFVHVELEPALRSRLRAGLAARWARALVEVLAGARTP